MSSATPQAIRVLVTGGGTGGHVGPALAVVQTLRERADAPGADFTLVFRYIGSGTGIEAKLAREAGLDFVAVQTGKLRRSSRGPIGLFSRSNLRDLFRIPVGITQSIREVKAFRPDVVLATGGYVSVPPVIAAGLLRIPVLTHEQTVTIGLANRIAGRFASRIALTFEGALADLPPSLRSKAFVTGNPVRSAIFQGTKTHAARRFGFAPEDDALPCVYVTGGAQGSRIINRAIETVLPQLLERTRVLHQCGQQNAGDEQDYDRLQTVAGSLPLHLRLRYKVIRFVETEAIGDAFALSDLLVSRSGAGTVTEACALGKPAIFIPLVPTGGDEQTRNAQRSVDAGAAVIITQTECEGPPLVSEVHGLLNDAVKREAMGRAALTLARPHAADELADALLGLVRQKTPQKMP